MLALQDAAAAAAAADMEKKDLIARITELESEVASYMADNRREKVAENVEYIRVWRQMKQCNEQLMASRAENESLSGKVRELKKALEEMVKLV